MYKRQSHGQLLPAAELPWIRMREVWIHAVDLDLGLEFADVPVARLETLLDHAVRHHAGRAEGPTIRLELDLPGGGQRTWELFGGDTAIPLTVRASADRALAWLTGRGDGSALGSALPPLPRWI